MKYYEQKKNIIKEIVLIQQQWWQHIHQYSQLPWKKSTFWNSSYASVSIASHSYSTPMHAKVQRISATYF